MKRRKSGSIGIVIGDGMLRAAQHVDGRLVSATVPADDNLDNLKKSMRQLLSAAPFSGRDVVLGLEGKSVLVESLVVPPHHAKSIRSFCADRLKGDPLFDSSKAAHGVSSGTAKSEQGRGATLAVLAAINSDRLETIIRTCREMELVVISVEAAPLAAWRAWSGEGVQARFLRSDKGDVVLAGQDDQLLFCRVVPGSISLAELSTTLSRATTLLGAQELDRLEATGLSEADMQILSGDLGMNVSSPQEEMPDAAAAGLAAEGLPLIDFTPPEERVLREKRRVRKMRIGVSGVATALVAAIAIMGQQQLGGLVDEHIALAARVDQIRDTRSQLEALQKEVQVQQANETVINEARPGHNMSTLFQLVSRAATSSISFETIQCEDRPDPSVPIDQRDDGPIRRMLEIQLNGLAANGIAVRDYADVLLSTKAFTDVRVESSERVLLGAGTEGERFRIYARAETR